MVALRFIHVVFGALWVGMAVYTAVFLMPAIQEAGPNGGKVMMALQRRGILTVLPVLAVGTLVSGLWLYWRVSGGLTAGFLISGPGLAFGSGGLASIVAYGLGITTMRPAMLRVAALMQGLGSVSSEPDRQVRMADIQRLRGRAALTGRLVAGLLILAVSAMAVARYL